MALLLQEVSGFPPNPSSPPIATPNLIPPTVSDSGLRFGLRVRTGECKNLLPFLSGILDRTFLSRPYILLQKGPQNHAKYLITEAMMRLGSLSGVTIYPIDNKNLSSNGFGWVRSPRRTPITTESLIDRAVASSMTLNLKDIPALLPGRPSRHHALAAV